MFLQSLIDFSSAINRYTVKAVTIHNIDDAYRDVTAAGAAGAQRVANQEAR